MHFISRTIFPLFFPFFFLFFSNVNAKQLNVCSEAGYAPFEWIDSHGDWDGYEVKVLTEFAKQENMQIKFFNMDYDALIPSLLAKKMCHLIASTLYVNVKRGDMVAFSHPILITHSSTMVRATDQEKYNRFEKINTPNTRVAVQTGTEDDLYARTYLKKAVVVGYSNNIDPIFALITKKVDVFLEDQSYIRLMIKKYPQKLTENKDVLEHNPSVGVAFGLRKDDVDLIKKINAFIDKMESNGSLKNWQKHYFHQ